MKILTIETCTKCPYFASQPLDHEDNRYLAICMNHDENIAWSQRIGRPVEPPQHCPLPDYNPVED